MLSDEWLSRYGLLENFNASVTRTRTRTRTGTGTWTTGVTAIALCTSCSRAKNRILFINTYRASEEKMSPKDIQTCIFIKFHDFSMIFPHFSNSMIFPCMELFLAIFHVFQVFQCLWEPCLSKPYFLGKHPSFQN